MTVTCIHAGEFLSTSVSKNSAEPFSPTKSLASSKQHCTAQLKHGSILNKDQRIVLLQVDCSNPQQETEVIRIRSSTLFSRRKAKAKRFSCASFAFVWVMTRASCSPLSSASAALVPAIFTQLVLLDVVAADDSVGSSSASRIPASRSVPYHSPRASLSLQFCAVHHCATRNNSLRVMSPISW